MIITVTVNPSLDRTLRLDRLIHRGVNRALGTHREPSGKGVNVALALHSAGTPTLAVLPLGGPAGTELGELLTATGLPARLVPIGGAVRSNLSLVEADGATTKINEAGPALTTAEAEALVAAAGSVGEPGDWLAWCGSLTAGFDPGRLQRAIATGRAAGRLVAVDTSEDALLAVLAGPADQLPDLVKPNVLELAGATRRPLRTLGDVAAAAAVLLERGIATVLVSLGADGALLLDRSGAVYGRAPVDRVVNTAGAGDAFLAGYLHGRHQDRPARETALATALVWGAIAVQHPGTVFPGENSTGVRPRAVIEALDPNRLLGEPAP